MFYFHILQYGQVGDGGAPLGAKPFQLILTQTSNTSVRVWLKDYDTLANAKTGAAGVFTAPSLSWTDSAASTQSVSAAFDVV